MKCPRLGVLRHVNKFAVVGGINTAVYYTVYLLLNAAVPYLAAHVLAIFIAMVGSFFLNCYWTFQTRPTWRKFALFPLTNATNYLLTTFGVVMLVEWLGVDERIAPLVAALAAIPVTFVLSRRILTGSPRSALVVPVTAGRSDGRSGPGAATRPRRTVKLPWQCCGRIGGCSRC